MISIFCYTSAHSANLEVHILKSSLHLGFRKQSLKQRLIYGLFTLGGAYNVKQCETRETRQDMKEC